MPKKAYLAQHLSSEQLKDRYRSSQDSVGDWRNSIQGNSLSLRDSSIKIALVSLGVFPHSRANCLSRSAVRSGSRVLITWDINFSTLNFKSSIQRYYMPIGTRGRGGHSIFPNTSLELENSTSIQIIPLNSAIAVFSTDNCSLYEGFSSRVNPACSKCRSD